MNLCFFIGKVVSEVKFDFIINGKNISVARFDLELSNKSIITIKAYNDLADYCYNSINKNNRIFTYGVVNSNYEILVKKIIILD